MGFLASYRRTRAVMNAVANWKTAMRGRLRSYVRNECKKKANARRLLLSYSTLQTEPNGEVHSQIDTLHDFGWFTVARHSFFTSAGCAIVADCCNRKYSFQCNMNYRMHDYWADSTGLGIGTGGFNIDGKWTEKLNESGTF